MRTSPIDIALLPDLETAAPESQYIVSEQIRSVGPGRVIMGSYAGAQSPVHAPVGINYVLVTLNPGERWTYEPAAGHLVTWVAVAKGALNGGERVSNGELGIFSTSRKRRSRSRARRIQVRPS